MTKKRPLSVKEFRLDYKKSKRTFQASYLVILFVYTITIIVLSCLGYSSLTENIELLQELNQNWESHPIVDMVITTTRQCPSQYQENLIEWDFSGFTEGCDCTNATNSSGHALGVSRGTCLTAQITAGCKLLAATSGFKMSFWGDTSTSSKICVKRDTNYTFLNTFEASQSSTCSEGYKTCMSTQETSNRFCVSEKSSCPVTGLLINSDLCDPADLNCQNINTQFNQEKSVTLFTGNDSLPIIEFAVNEYAMCTSKSQQNISPGRSDYILRNSARTTCNSEGASLWNIGVIDSMKESDFYELNGLLPLIQAVPDISTYFAPDSTSEILNADYKIFARTYAKWNTNCTNYFNGVIENNEFLTRLKGVQGIVIAFTLISGLFTGFILPSHVLSKIVKHKKLQWAKKFGHLFGWNKNPKRNLMHLLKLLPLPSLIAAVAITSNGKKFFKFVGEGGCSDPEWNGVFLQISRELALACLYDSILIGLLIALILLDVVTQVWLRNRKRNKPKPKATKVVPVTLSVKIPVDVVVTPASIRELICDLSPSSGGTRATGTFAMSQLSP